MDWFQRYGITGSYFLVFLIAWLYALFPCKIHNFGFINIFGIIAAAFLPVGYLITIFQQSIYLNNKNKRRGIHLWAKNEMGCIFPDEGKLKKYWRKCQKDFSEAEIEVLSTFSLIDYNEIIDIKYQKHFQDWHRRRMDVLVISSSMLTATFILYVLVICILCSHILLYKSIPKNINGILLLILFIISVFIIFILWWNKILIRKQIRRFLYLIFRRYINEEERDSQDNRSDDI